MSVSSATDIFPNLPGYRPSAPKPRSPKKTQLFRLIDGMVFPKDMGTDEEPPSADTGGDLLTLGPGGTYSMTPRPLSRPHVITPHFNAKTANVILSFIASFHHISPNGSLDDDKKLRKANIYYYLEDGTMSIIERPQLNSGVPQGTICRRSVVWKAEGQPYSPEDFKLGGEIEVFGQKYCIVDCDYETRRFMERILNRDPESGLDEFSEYDELSSVMDNSQTLPPITNVNAGSVTGAATNGDIDPDAPVDWGKFRSKKSGIKMFMEAKLGNTVNNKGREGFLKYGNSTLKFLCIWDNTSKLFGDLTEYSLVYHLSDDTVEIFTASGHGKTHKEQFSRLLQRSKLPKKFTFKSIGDTLDDAHNGFYKWTDLHIGMDLDVYARALRIIDADAATRRFYMTNHVPLADKIEFEEPTVVIHEREIPPYTGFGSEEDSLRSCQGSLMPGPPRVKKLGENKTLTYLAALVSGNPDDVNRRFVFSYFVQDGTIKVEEKPTRNSGFVGGVFLSRRAVKTPQGEQMTERHLYLGATVAVFKHNFRLLEANGGTLRWLEDKSAYLPFANFSIVMDKLKMFPQIIADAMDGTLSSKFESVSQSKEVGRDALAAVLGSYGAYKETGGQEALSLHEVTTVIRALSDRGAAMDVAKFIAAVQQ